jgi:beta-galactosidase
MFSPDREPHPAVAEIKFLQQPVLFSLATGPFDESSVGLHVTVASNSSAFATLRVINRYSFSDLSHLAWSWQLTSDRSAEVIRSERFDVPVKMRIGEVVVNLSSVVSRVRHLEKSRSARGNSYWLNIRGFLCSNKSWADAGHVLVTQQFAVKFDFLESLPRTLACEPGPTGFYLEAASNENTIEIFRVIDEKSVLFATLDQRSGALVSFAPSGHNVLSNGGVMPNFIRAPTDNDKGGMELTLNFMFPFQVDGFYSWFRGLDEFSYYSHWKKVGLDGSRPPTVVCSRTRITDASNSSMVGIVALCSVFAPGTNMELFKVKIHYTIFADGRIRMSNHVVPQPFLKKTTSIPRVGVNMLLDPSLYHVQYYGRGPHENYPDRKAGAEMGVFDTTPADMAYYKYVVPGENGSRSDCEWVSFRDDNGDGLCVVSTSEDGNPSFSCSAILHSAPELHAARHTCDLERRENGKHPVHVCIDHKLMGVGGDNR